MVDLAVLICFLKEIWLVGPYRMVKLLEHVPMYFDLCRLSLVVIATEEE